MKRPVRSLKGSAMRDAVLALLPTPHSYAQIASKLGVPRSSVEFHLKKLEAQGLVRRVGSRGSGAAGRPRILFQLSPPQVAARFAVKRAARDPLLGALYATAATS